MIDINKMIEDEIQRNTTQLQLTVRQQVEEIRALNAELLRIQAESKRSRADRDEFQKRVGLYQADLKKACDERDKLQEECNVRNNGDKDEIAHVRGRNDEHLARIKQLEDLLSDAYEAVKSAKNFLTEEVVIDTKMTDKIERILLASVREADFSDCVTDASDLETHEQELDEILESISSAIGIKEDEDE